MKQTAEEIFEQETGHSWWYFEGSNKRPRNEFIEWLKESLISHSSTIASLREENERLKASKWVSVEERLPEEGKEVLFLYDSNSSIPCIGFYTYGNKVEFYNKDDEPDFLEAGFYESCQQMQSDYDEAFFQRHGVTKWMPLPEKP